MIYILADRETGKHVSTSYNGRAVNAYYSEALARRYSKRQGGYKSGQPADILVVDPLNPEATHWLATKEETDGTA